MSKGRFALVAVLFFLIVGGIYSLYFFYLNPTPGPVFKLVVGIFSLIVVIILLINYYKKNVK